MTSRLLLLSLGPIQDFIASARRCQDLWFGSWMLSDLSRATAIRLGEIAGRQALVYPASLDDDETAVANKILVVLPPEVAPSDAAGAAQEAMSDRLGDLAEEAFTRLERSAQGTAFFDRATAETQVRDLMELQWVCVPMTSGFGPARAEAETLLAARKNTRTWDDIPWEGRDGVPKSSLDGLRESVLHESLYRDVSEGRRSPDWLRRTFHVKPSERLCGVGLLKRMGEDPQLDLGGSGRKRPAFHSTSHLAAAPLMLRIARRGSAGAEALGAYLDVLRHLGVDLDRFTVRMDGTSMATLRDPFSDDMLEVPRLLAARAGHGLDAYILFEDRLREIVDQYRLPSPQVDDKRVPDSGVGSAESEARTGLQELLRQIDQRSPPNPYFAVLVADGDQLGKTLNSLADEQQHRTLGAALDAFARRARAVVERNAGSLVYAGGDDVLALLPLHGALSCAAELRSVFGECIATAIPAGVSAPTLSVGLGIAHHMDPMDEARMLAHRAEQIAKEGGRNRLAIVASKRSGATLEACGDWSDPHPLHERLLRWVKRLHDEEIPHGVAFELDAAMAPFELATESASQTQVVAAVAGRIVGRKRRGQDNEPIDAAISDELAARFDGDRGPIVAVRELSAEIQIARLLLASYRNAWG